MFQTLQHERDEGISATKRRQCDRDGAADRGETSVSTEKRVRWEPDSMRYFLNSEQHECARVFTELGTRLNEVLRDMSSKVDDSRSGEQGMQEAIELYTKNAKVAQSTVDATLDSVSGLRAELERVVHPEAIEARK